MCRRFGLALLLALVSASVHALSPEEIIAVLKDPVHSTGNVADAVDEGRFIASRKRGAVAPEGPAVVERTPEEEAAHEAAQADARRQAAEAAAAPVQAVAKPAQKAEDILAMIRSRQQK
jgi:predicted ATPase